MIIREKIINYGTKGLSDAELLALLLGGDGEANLPIARELLAEYGNNLAELARAEFLDLKRFKGIGNAKAATISAFMELARRKTRAKLPHRVKIEGSTDAFMVASPILSDLNVEQFWILLLNRANEITKKVCISEGGVAGTVVDAKIIFKAALENLASGVILLHNHPSGNIRPSGADIDITRKLAEAGKVLDIRVLDHLVVGGNSYYSFADEGLMV